MNKLILTLLFLLTSVLSFAQCSTLANFADSTFGVWPDTIQNLPHAIENEAYNTVLYVKAPANSSELGFGAIPIDSLVIENVGGLPTGLTFGCGNDDCSVNGGDYHCFYISGTTSQTGTFVLDIQTTGYAGAFNLPYSFAGYKLVVEAATSIKEVENLFYVEQNMPNPFVDKTIINYNLLGTERVILEVYNILGTLVYNDSHISNGNDYFEIDNVLIAGNYIYKISSSSQSVVKKMIVISK